MFALPGFAQSCGGNGDRPCKVWERIPSCNSGLVEDFLKNKCVSKGSDTITTTVNDIVKPKERPGHCGRKGQKPCTIDVYIPSCVKGLTEDILSTGLCIDTEAEIKKAAELHWNDQRNFALELTKSSVACVGSNLPSEQSVLSTQYGIQLASKPCFQNLLLSANRAGYQTLTIGVAGGIALGLGADGEAGLAFPTSGNGRITRYETEGYSFGWQTGAGADIVLSLFKKANSSSGTNFGGDSHGATVELAAGAGLSYAVWFEYDGTHSGFSIAPKLGVGFGSAYARGRTRIYNTNFSISGAGISGPSGFISAGGSTPTPGSSEPQLGGGTPIMVGALTKGTYVLRTEAGGSSHCLKIGDIDGKYTLQKGVQSGDCLSTVSQMGSDRKNYLFHVTDRGNGKFTLESDYPGVRQCVIFGSNGQDKNTMLYNWGGGANGYCGFSSNHELANNNQATFTITEVGYGGQYTMRNASNGTNQCLLFMGNGTEAVVSRYNWGSGVDGPHCGFPSEDALINNMQAIFYFDRLE